MPKEKPTKTPMVCVDDLRHAEYYQMQTTFDELYAKSSTGEIFTNLMPLILQRENILLAYRNIKGNSGSVTPGTDRLSIKDIGKLTPDEVVKKVRYFLTGSKHGYRPKPVRRKDIPKPNGTTRPLGIPCIWDRLIQQCIKQIMEPICEAKFSEISFGFRPQRSAEHAIQKTYKLMQNSNLHFIVEFDIKGFFDNVNHSKLIKQIWSLGIQDKHLIYIIRQILKAPIKMPDNSITYPTKGTPQGGIISPLLANIVLNELDWWIESQWRNHPVANKYAHPDKVDGHINKTAGYKAMRRSNLKEMQMVRYADDFRILCRTKDDADKVMVATTKWLSDRLKLEVSPEKTRVVNTRQKYSEFLGFKMKVRKKGSKHTVRSHMCDKALKRQRQNLSAQAKNIAKPRPGKSEVEELRLYNSMVLGIQNYYRFATHISRDCSQLNRSVMTIFTNRLRTDKGSRLRKKGRKLTETEKQLYGKSLTIRYISGSNEPIYPISYIKTKAPIGKRRCINPYTPEGRVGIHDNLRVNVSLMWLIMKQPLHNRSAEYADNRISLFTAQWGKCGITGIPFQKVEDVHCHHKIPVKDGGTDKYANLILVHSSIHRLIHATEKAIIEKHLYALDLSQKQIEMLNKYRLLVGNRAI